MKEKTKGILFRIGEIVSVILDILLNRKKKSDGDS